MNKKEYLTALNKELNKLNGVIDRKIIHDADYHREARRHKQLLQKIRKEQMQRSIMSLFSFYFLRNS